MLKRNRIRFTGGATHVFTACNVVNHQALDVESDAEQIKLSPYRKAGPTIGYIGIPKDKEAVMALADTLLKMAGLGGMQEFALFMRYTGIDGINNETYPKLLAEFTTGYFVIKDPASGGYLQGHGKSYAFGPVAFAYRVLGQMAADRLRSEVESLNPELEGKLELCPINEGVAA